MSLSPVLTAIKNRRSRQVDEDLAAMRAYTPPKSLTTDSLTSCYSVIKNGRRPNLDQIESSGSPRFDTMNLWRKAWKQ